MPAIRTGDPLLIPATLGNVVLSEYCCQKKPPPPTAKIRAPVRIIATTAIIPSFSSANARERVRGMT
jgi:hypothetical protein